MEQIRSIAPPAVFETKRLILRRPACPTREHTANYASDPEVSRFMTWRPYNDRNEVAPFFAVPAHQWDSGEEYSWVITLTGDDRAVGMIGCRAREHAADIGYVPGRACSGPWICHGSGDGNCRMGEPARNHLSCLGGMRCGERGIGTGTGKSRHAARRYT